MKITIIGRKVNLRDSFKEKVEKKLKKFERFFGDDAEANVTVSLEKNRQTVEVTVHSRDYIYRAEQTSSDMEEALDKACDRLSGQIRKYKTRIDKRIKSGNTVADFAVLEEDAQPVAEEEDFEIVRAKKFAVKPMDIDEAILQMNMLGHEFFMFRNVLTNEINVVYKRVDGNYGLLEPTDE